MGGRAPVRKPAPRSMARPGSGVASLLLSKRPSEARMNGVALRILLGDRAKYVGLIFGIAFSTMLMSNQISIFAG